MSTHTDPVRDAVVEPSIVYIDPSEFEQYVAPLLRQRQNRGLRAKVLKAIMAQPHAMIRVLLNPDWETVDKEGLPTAYSLERVDSLPRHLYACLKATSRIVEGGDYADRTCWREAITSTH